MDGDNQYRAIVAELPRLRRYALALTRDAERSDDLVQESAARAMSNMNKWMPGTNLGSWLMTILHNLFINDSVRRRPLLTRTGDIDPEVPVHAAQEARDNLRDVADAFTRLRPDQREVLWLACVEERDFREIADQLRIPLGTVRSRLCRAREQLRQDLKIID